MFLLTVFNKYNIINQNTQRYKISSFYTQAYSNNTIKCVVIKDKVTYTAVKELTFGPSGTAGTDYTFVLDFDDGETALTLDSDFKEGETIPAVFAAPDVTFSTTFAVSTAFSPLILITDIGHFTMPTVRSS